MDDPRHLEPRIAPDLLLPVSRQACASEIRNWQPMWAVASARALRTWDGTLMAHAYGQLHCQAIIAYDSQWMLGQESLRFASAQPTVHPRPAGRGLAPDGSDSKAPALEAESPAACWCAAVPCLADACMLQSMQACTGPDFGHSAAVLPLAWCPHGHG